MFKRRKIRSWMQILREALWPSMGWSRAVKYAWIRMQRLAASPHAIALGVSFGIFASFTPFMGIHILLAIVLAYLLSGNILAAALGTVFGNPLTFPLIWMAGYQFGALLLGDYSMAAPPLQPDMAQFSAEHLEHSRSVILTMMVGGLPLGLISAVLCYFPVRMTVTGFQAARRQRLAGGSRNRGTQHHQSV